MCLQSYLWKKHGNSLFCKIPFPDENNLLHVLITCNHVLNINSRRSNYLNTIEFSVDNKEYNLSLDNSRLLYNNEKPYDITIIEIKKSDGLNEENFLNIDKTIFTQQKNDYYNELSIYILHHEEGKELKYSPGTISSTYKNYVLYYTCQTEPGSSGGPIINSNNLQVIGYHIGYSPRKEKNRGKLIARAINDFIILKANKLNNQPQNDYRQGFTEKNDSIDNQLFSEIQKQLQKESKNQNTHKYWVCDSCNRQYDSFIKPSFYSQGIDFSLCDSCFSSKKEDQVNPLKENDNIKKKSEQAKLLIEKENSYKNNEPVTSFDLYDNSIHNHYLIYYPELPIKCNFCGILIDNTPGYMCDSCYITLCLDCADKIYKRNINKTLHKYNGHRLELQKNITEYNCSICSKPFLNISLHCKKCEFDICYECYLKNS